MDLVERWVQLSDRRPLVAAGAVAVLVAVCSVIALRFEQRGGRPGDPSIAAALIVVAASAFLTVKRSHPWWALAGTFGGAVAYVTYSSDFNSASVLPLAVALCAIASVLPARTAIIATAAAVAGLTIAGLVVGPHWLLVERIGLVGWPLLGAGIGGVTRARSSYVSAVETRAQVASALYEYEAQRRVMEERLRISRDIHDVVAHHLSALNLQIGTARHLLDRPELAAEALSGMHENSEAALRDIKGMVGLLRADDHDGHAHAPPGLADIDQLVRSVQDVGREVDVLVRGLPCGVPDDVGLAAYRLVQEALTNAVKYAADDRIGVLIHYRVRTVRIEVSNRQAATAVDGRAIFLRKAESEGGRVDGGFGLAGMAERVAAAGGHLEAGARGDRFVVSVELPTKDIG